MQIVLHYELVIFNDILICEPSQDLKTIGNILGICQANIVSKEHANTLYKVYSQDTLHMYILQAPFATAPCV